LTPVTIKDLLEAGAHFGHQTKRWNPKMKPFIFGKRNGIYIIDLQQTLTRFQQAVEFVHDVAVHGGSILFVGTKRQAQEAISEEAGRVGMPYVTTRWLGGTLTNFATIKRRIERLRYLENSDADQHRREGLTKKELIGLEKEKEKLAKVLSGLKHMNSLPAALFVVDPSKERIAVTEARKLRIPVVAIVDTNCDPDEVDYCIPGNDDAIRAIRLFASRVADMITEGAGVYARHSAEASGEPTPEPVESMGGEGDARGARPRPRARRASTPASSAAAASAPAEIAAASEELKTSPGEIVAEIT
jgi:small subunit ribosomal protein S2